MSALQTNSKDKATSDLLAQLEQLKAENAKLKEAQTSRISFEVSEKGALSLYGMGRFPVTLYKSQWERLIQVVPQILKFIEDNKDKLAEKA